MLVWVVVGSFCIFIKPSKLIQPQQQHRSQFFVFQLEASSSLTLTLKNVAKSTIIHKFSTTPRTYIATQVLSIFFQIYQYSWCLAWPYNLQLFNNMFNLWILIPFCDAFYICQMVWKGTFNHLKFNAYQEPQGTKSALCFFILNL